MKIITRQTSRSKLSRRGFLLFEAVLALLIFSIMAVALTRTLAGVRQTSLAVQQRMQISRILDNQLNEILTLRVLEEGDIIEDNKEIEGQIRTIIEPLELENEDGQILPRMFRIRITAIWFQDGKEIEESVEGWRNGRLYAS